MFQNLFDGVQKARDDLRNRAGALVYLSDFLAIGAALLPILKLLPQGNGTNPPPAAVGAGALMNHSQLLAAASRPMGHDELADGLDGFLQHAEQVPEIKPGNVGALGDGTLLRGVLEKLGPMLIQLFIKSLAGV